MLEVMRQRVAVLLGCGTAWLLSACGANHFVQRGADLYGEGRYVEADEVFERSEARVARAPLTARAAYAAYRGATFMALGDFEHAERWLGLASTIEHSRPGTLSRRELGFLESALQALNRHRVQIAPGQSAAVIASTGQVPNIDSGTRDPSSTRRTLVEQ